MGCPAVIKMRVDNTLYPACWRKHRKTYLEQYPILLIMIFRFTESDRDSDATGIVTDSHIVQQPVTMAVAGAILVIAIAILSAMPCDPVLLGQERETRKYDSNRYYK